jgi:hypothetical protein
MPFEQRQQSESTQKNIEGYHHLQQHLTGQDDLQLAIHNRFRTTNDSSGELPRTSHRSSRSALV